MYNNYTFVNEINELPKGPHDELYTWHTLKCNFGLDKSLLEKKNLCGDGNDRVLWK